MLLIYAENITGGEVMAFQSPQEAPILKLSLRTGEYVVLNDKQAFHDAAPLVPEPNPSPSHWDLVVLTANQAAE